MDSESEQSSGMSGQIEDLIVDLGNEKFMTRHEALGSLREMLPTHEKAIATELVRWVQLYGKSDAGGSASFVNKAAMELFQEMTEMGLEPLINEGLAEGDFYARRSVMDAIGRTGRMSVLPYLIAGMDDGDKYTRWQAAKGLGRYAGSSEAREALVKGLSDSDPYVRRRAGRSLENFGGVGPGEDKVEGPMEEDGEGDIDGTRLGRRAPHHTRAHSPTAHPSASLGTPAHPCAPSDPQQKRSTFVTTPKTIFIVARVFLPG